MPITPFSTLQRISWKQAQIRWMKWLEGEGIRAARFQQRAWKAFEAGKSGLIVAPTGSGKTLAAIGGPLMQAIAMDEGSKSPTGVRILWVTPLRALASDTAGHLLQPVKALLPHWQTVLRTGDASAKDKSAALKGRANLLVITPESLAILLSSEAGSETFRTLRAVVVDEWHELLPSKRGVLLQLNLARLRRISPHMQIWGVSATIGNLDEALDVLVRERDVLQKCIIQDARTKPFYLQTLIPPEKVRLPWAGHLGLANLAEVLQLVLRQRSCIVFTNTRSQAELWYTALSSVWPLQPDTLALHHGSLDPVMRKQVEDSLKSQSARCVVATSSLDLGVDFPAVDLVIQIGGTHSVARIVQRAGRAKHKPGAPVHITAVATHALEMCEFAALRELAQAQQFEARSPMQLCMDVLSQHVMSMAVAGGFTSAEMLTEVRSTAAYHNLAASDWHAVLNFLVHGGDALDAYPQYRRLVCDGGRYMPADLKIARRHRLAIGTITDTSMVSVQFLKGARLGSVDEAFISRLQPGDVFNFAGRSLELFRIENMTAWVRKSAKKSTLTPAWNGGNLPFSTSVGERMKSMLHAAVQPKTELVELAYLNPLLQLQNNRSHVPAEDELLLETLQTKNARNGARSNRVGMGQAWFMYPFAGRMVHESLALLLAHRIAKLQANTVAWSCNHMGLMLMPAVHVDVHSINWRDLFQVQGLEADLAQAINFTEIARRKFREIAQIAGLLNVRLPGMRFSSRQLQVSAGLLFDVLNKYDPDHVLIQSAKKEAIESELHVQLLKQVLSQMQQQRLVVCSPNKLTPFSFGLWAESLRGQLTNETWAARIRRMAQQLDG